MIMVRTLTEDERDLCGRFEKFLHSLIHDGPDASASIHLSAFGPSSNNDVGSFTSASVIAGGRAFSGGRDASLVGRLEGALQKADDAHREDVEDRIRQLRGELSKLEGGQ